MGLPFSTPQKIKDMNEMSEYYQELKNKRKAATKQTAERPKHTGNWELVYIVGKGITSIIRNAPYPLCASEKKKRLQSGQYKLGKFTIRPWKA